MKQNTKNMANMNIQNEEKSKPDSNHKTRTRRKEVKIEKT